MAAGRIPDLPFACGPNPTEESKARGWPLNVMGMIDLQALYLTLRKWKANPGLPRKDVSVLSGHKSGSRANRPFSQKEISRMKAELKKGAPTSYNDLFPDEL